MTTEAESRREKAMPQASSSTDDPAPGEHAGGKLQRLRAKERSVGREQEQCPRRTEQSGDDEGGRGVQRANEPGIENARDEQQEPVHENGTRNRRETADR